MIVRWFAINTRRKEIRAKLRCFEFPVWFCTCSIPLFDPWNMDGNWEVWRVPVMKWWVPLKHGIWGFLKWWYQTTIGFPTKNDHFGVFWGYHQLRKHPYVAVLWKGFSFFLFCGGNPKINLPVTKESNDALRCNSPRFTAVYTLPETHMAPQNWWLGDYFPLGRPIFRGYVSFRECNSDFLKSKFSIQIFLGEISQKKLHKKKNFNFRNCLIPSYA